MKCGRAGSQALDRLHDLEEPSRLCLCFPLLQVIFIQPDSPWLWQQSGLWEPDANQAAQMSGAESQENAS